MSDPTPDDGHFPRLYDELRRLAGALLAEERVGHSLNATALVHEAYLRLGGADFEGRSAFLRSASVAMRRILVDHARRKRAGKRGGGARVVGFEDVGALVASDPDLLLDLDAALSRLAAEDESSAEVARCRLFAGLSTGETAEVLGISRASAYREWSYARSWLAAALRPAR